MQKYVMGIDNGGTAIKASIFSMDGKEIGCVSKNTKLITPAPYHTEREMDELWEANAYVIREVLKETKISPEQISGLALTGAGNGLYLLGHDDTIIRNGIISTDGRAESYAKNWYKNPDFETKILPKTLQSMWGGNPATLLSWLDEYEPDMLEKTKYIFMGKDFIRYKLTGEAFLELTDISSAGIINVRDGIADDDIFAFFGLEEWKSKMPPLIKTTEVAGYITKEAAALTGLKEGTPVAGGTSDIAASVLASGLTEENQLAIVTGTWSFNEYISKEPIVDKELFMTSRYPIDGYYLISEASKTSASNLEWFINKFLLHEKNHAEARGMSIYDYCNQLVEHTPPEESNILYFPFLYGSNGVEHGSATFIGMNSWHNIHHFVRALYEGIAFSHAYHVERLTEMNPNLTGPARIAGGVTNSKVWLQMFADVLQRPLEIADTKQHGTLGTAMSAAVMAGEYESMKEAAKNMVHIGKVIEPNEQNYAIYEKKYKHYKATLKALEAAWKLEQNEEEVTEESEEPILSNV